MIPTCSIFVSYYRISLMYYAKVIPLNMVCCSYDINTSW